MRAVRMGWIAIALVGCSKPGDKPAETADAAATAMADAAPEAISLGDIAGTWAVHSTVQGDESKSVTYDLTATADTSGWTITFPGREPIPTRVVAVEGDSIVTESGPFESALRQGVQVNARVVTRLRGDKLVGHTVARYQVTGPDTVTHLDFEGSRKP